MAAMRFTQSKEILRSGLLGGINLQRSNDFIAWAGEKTGNFTVRSAYRMALEEQNHAEQVATSTSPSGERSLWKLVWGGLAPPKVKVFAWKLASNSLPTWEIKHSRKLELDDICPICSAHQEDSFHALCRCTLARALWKEMALTWSLPDVSRIVNTGPEWLFDVLRDITENMRLKVLMLLWRIWYVRNEIVHEKAAPPTNFSKRFLCSYVSSILNISQNHDYDPVKGKGVIGENELSRGVVTHPDHALINCRWAAPDTGWVKLNTDGSYLVHDGSAATGMVLRDSEGAIIFTACRHLLTCDSALESELSAIYEGVSLAMQWSNLPIVVELDCLEAVNLLRNKEIDR